MRRSTREAKPQAFLNPALAIAQPALYPAEGSRVESRSAPLPTGGIARFGVRSKTMNGEPATYEIHGSAAVVTLNRPDRRNALSRALIQGLTEAFTRARDDS